MGSYLGAVWQCRFFWMSLVKMDLRTRYRRSILGMGWSLLHPIAMTTILCIVFQNIWKQSLEGFALYLFAGLATWNFIQQTTMTGCQCFFQGESYIRQHPAPLAIYPLRTALGGTIHFLIALSVTLAIAWYCNGLSQWVPLLSLVPTIILLFVFVWSTAVLAGFANVHFQDTQHLAEVGFQILFYASAIVYKVDLLPERLAWLVEYSPLVALLDLVREPVVNGQLPSPQVVIVSTVTVALTALAACCTLWRLQRKLIFHL
jgi:lipopolysaccharide transport system permease protein